MRATEERIVFAEEREPGERVRVFVCGELTDALLDALANYVERQRRRLAQQREMSNREEIKGEVGNELVN